MATATKKAKKTAPAAEEVVDAVDNEEAPATLTPAELALQLGTDPKTCRRFLRSVVENANRPGKGARWAIDASLVPELKERFEARGKSKVVEQIDPGYTAEELEAMDDDLADEDIEELEDIDEL